MKIGAGGLQSMLTHDNINVKQLDPGRGRVALDQQQMQAQNLGQKPLNLTGLFQAIDRLNQLAQMHNYPLLFKLVRDRHRRPMIRVDNKKTGQSHQLTLKQVTQMLQQPQPAPGKGKKIDDYA